MPCVRRWSDADFVVASFLLWLGAAVLLWWDLGNVFLVVGLLTVGGYALLNRTVRLVADAPNRALDERLVAVRNAAYRTSYRIVGVVTALALLALSVVGNPEWVAFELEGHHLRALLWGFLGLAILMPSAVLAWREREV